MGTIQSKNVVGWITMQVTKSIGSVLIRNSSCRRLCSNRRLHGSVVQCHPNPKFSNSQRKSSHANVTLSRRTGQFGEIQQIHEWTFCPIQRRMAPAKHPPIWQKPSTTHTWIISPSQIKRRIVLELGSNPQQKLIHEKVRLTQDNRIRQGADFRYHNKKRASTHGSKEVEETVLRIQRTTISTRPFP